jgi:hypothetical protein
MQEVMRPRLTSSLNLQHAKKSHQKKPDPVYVPVPVFSANPVPNLPCVYPCCGITTDLPSYLAPPDELL